LAQSDQHRRKVPTARGAPRSNLPGQSALLEPAFYEQLGQDPDEIEQAKQALVARLT
jgi:hypothetical protein